MFASKGRELVPIRNGRFSLRAVLFAGAILVPAGLFALGAWQSRIALEDQAEQEVRSQLRILQENAVELFQTYRLVLDQADLRVSGHSWDEIRNSRTLWEDLRKLTERLPQVDAVFMIDPDGMSALTTRAFPSPPVDFSDRDYFAAQRNADAGFFIGRSYIGRISQHRIINFSIRRRGSHGAFNGVIGLSAFDYIDRFYTSLTSPGPGTLIALVRDDGELLAGNDVARGSGVAVALTRLATEGNSALHHISSGKHGEQLLVGQVKLRNFPAYVVYGVSDAVILDAWIRSLERWALLAFGTGLMLLLLARQLIRYIAAETLAKDRLREVQTDLLVEAQKRQIMEVQFAQMRKFETLGRAASAVAHDFNNILSLLSLNLDLLRSQVRGDPKISPFIERWRQAIGQGSALTERLLDVLRGEPIAFAALDVNERISTRLEMLREIAAGTTVEFFPARDLWKAQADGNQLDLALINLVANARDAMANDGRVEISTRNIATEQNGNAEIGEFVSVVVQDDGPGIPRNIIARVLQPFFTTKAPGKGTGLGLAIVADFVHDSGGTLSIETPSGGGTKIDMRLRRAVAEPHAGSAHEPQGAAVPQLASPQEPQGGRRPAVETPDHQ